MSARNGTPMILPMHVATLSTLSENARTGLDHRELRRDAFDTVTQTVTRMTALLGRRRDAPDGGAVEGSR